MALGIAPPVEDTPVGDVRLLIGDVNFTPAVDQPGFGEYEYFSDAEIRVFLKASADSIKGAGAIAYGQIANGLILTIKNIATDDLRISTEKRAELMLKVATQWREDAAAEAALVGGGGFDLIPFEPLAYSYPY